MKHRKTDQPVVGANSFARPQDLSGASEMDNSVERMPDGGYQGNKNPDQGEVGLLNEATTADGGIAVDGGKLGNKDDFEDDMPNRTDQVAGAHGEGTPDNQDTEQARTGVAQHRPSNLESG